MFKNISTRRGCDAVEIEKLVQELYDVAIQKQQLAEQEQNIKEQLHKLMIQKNIDNLETVKIKIALVKGVTRKYIDRDKLKTLFPEASKTCIKEVDVGEFVKVTLK
jgi:hypothetical protein